MSAPTQTPQTAPPLTDAEVLDAENRHRAGYLPPGMDAVSLHTMMCQSPTSIPEGCAGLVAPGLERCAHLLLGRDEYGHAVVPPGGLGSTTIVYRGATGSAKTHFAGRVVAEVRSGPEP